MASSSLVASVTHSTSTSSSTPQPSDLGSQTSSRDPRFIIVGAVLGTFALVLLVFIYVITLRVRRRQLNDGEKSLGPFQGTALDKTHPASKIMPFSVLGSESHKFQHVPGHDMRIALRRPDGAWDFADPNDPFAPYGVTEIVPSPITPTGERLVSSTRKKATRSKSGSTLLDLKGHNYSGTQLIEMGYRSRDEDLDIGDLHLPHPPPAYGCEPVNEPHVMHTPTGVHSPRPA